MACLLREEFYINSNRDKKSKADIIIIQIGPVFATIAMFSVDAFYYLLFAKPLRDALRLQRAKPPQASIDVVDMAYHQPLMKTQSLELNKTLSRYTCVQHVSTVALGREDCLQLVLRQWASAEQTRGPHVMIWLHDDRTTPGNARSSLSERNGVQLTSIHDVALVCA